MLGPGRSPGPTVRKAGGLSRPVQTPTPPRMLQPQPGDHLSHPWLREERLPGLPCPSPSAKRPRRNSRRHVSRHCTAIRGAELLPPALLQHTQGPWSPATTTPPSAARAYCPDGPSQICIPRPPSPLLQVQFQLWHQLDDGPDPGQI